MLVLTRKPGEQIKVYGPCVITAIGNNQIGIEAEPYVSIVRAELELTGEEPTDVYEEDDE